MIEIILILGCYISVVYIDDYLEKNAANRFEKLGGHTVLFWPPSTFKFFWYILDLQFRKDVKAKHMLVVCYAFSIALWLLPVIFVTTKLLGNAIKI